MPALTGAPTVTFQHQQDFMFDTDAFWKILEHADKQGYIMTTAIATDDLDD